MTLAHPERREELLSLLESFADLRHQKLYWVRNKTTPDIEQSFSDAANDLLEAVENDGGVSDAWALIGSSLRTEEEAEHVQRVAQLLEDLTKELPPRWRGWSGGRTLARFLNQPGWQELRAEAARALVLLRRTQSDR